MAAGADFCCFPAPNPQPKHSSVKLWGHSAGGSQGIADRTASKSVSLEGASPSLPIKIFC